MCRSNPAVTAPFDVAAEATKPPAQRRYLSADEAANVYGAATADIDAVKAFAAAHGLDVVRVNQAGRSVKLGGSADAVGEAFGVQLRQFTHPGGSFRGHDGAVQLPAELEGIVTGVFGLDTRRMGRSFLRAPAAPVQDALQTFATERRRRHSHAPAQQQQPANTYLPPQVAQLYGFPAVQAASQTVAVLAFNGSMGTGASVPGGYDATILKDYFTSDLDLPMPTITDVTVQGPGNSPGDGSNPNDSSPEVYLDLSIVGSLATGAPIIVYFTEFTEQGWVDAITTATTDTTNAPGVISISYGNPEDGAGTAWTSAVIAQVNTAFEQAASQGKTITCASGDNGAATVRAAACTSTSPPRARGCSRAAAPGWSRAAARSPRRPCGTTRAAGTAPPVAASPSCSSRRPRGRPRRRWPRPPARRSAAGACLTYRRSPIRKPHSSSPSRAAPAGSAGRAPRLRCGRR